MASPDPHNDDDLPDLKPGDVVAGRFRIVEIIGTGGFSVVYRAHQEGMNRFVALKVLKPTASSDQKLVERFRREALFASQLSHPNTITLFDYGQTDGDLCYIAMEYLDGHDLGEDLKYREPLELERVWSILAQTCQSLAEAHQIGLIHRDLKPENVYLMEVDDREFVKILDFGVSKALSNFAAPDASSLAPLTQEGTVFGTPLYMAPEQAMAEDLTPAVDVYALGHLAYEMITGKAKYAGETSPMDVMLAQINDPPLQLPGPWSDTPFGEVLKKATRKDPDRRLPDASAMLDELMREEFADYISPDVQPNPAALSGGHRPALDLPVGEGSPDDRRDSEEVHRAELSSLEEALETVRESAEMRLMVIQGDPGTGRSNLLRAFLARHRNESGLRIVHRQHLLDGRCVDAGLEADLADATGLQLQGRGIDEINRLLREVLSDTEVPPLKETNALNVDSDPLSRLASRRHDFFTRLIEPFRRAARVGSLIWGIENLENVDPLTLAFLERFIREMRVHPAPVLLVVTVHPDSLIRRPGLMRYAEEIVNAPSTYARHLHLTTSEEAVDDPTAAPGPPPGLAEISSDVDVGGSYSGTSPSVPDDLDFDEDVGRWAALADGRSVDDEAGDEPSSPDDEAVTAAPAADADEDEKRGDYERRRSEQADTGPTERLELFTTETTTGEFDRADPQVLEAFDTVLGYLAQLDDHVVSREPWEFVYPRVLSFETSRMMNTILEYAERFGILNLSEEAVAFTDREYAAALRETFNEREEAEKAHAELAELLEEFTPEPDRENVRRIVHHAVRGRQYERAVELLLRVGDAAYSRQDLDLAREYYLQFQSLIDELSTHSPPPEVTYKPYPEAWLRIGEIQGAIGEYGAAEDALRRAIHESRPKDHRIRAAAHKLLGDLAVAQQRYEYARECFESARELYQETSLARPFVASLGEIGRCSVQLGQPRQAEGTLLTALDRARNLEDLPLQARLHRYMGEVLTRQGRFLEAVDHLEQSMKLFEDRNEYRNVITCLNELGQAHYAAGQFEQSRDRYTRALGRLSTRHLQLEKSPHLGLARALAALDDLEEAKVHLVEAMSHYSTRNQPVERARVQFHLGDLYLARQSPQLADDHYQHVVDVGERVGHRRLAFDGMVRRAYALFDDGEHGRCFSVLTDAREFANNTDDREAMLMARAHIIYLQLVLHDFEASGEMFSGLLSQLDEGGLRPSHVLCDLFRSDVAAARGVVREALDLLDKTRQQAAGLGEYGLFIPLARREHLLRRRLGEQTDSPPEDGWPLGSLLPPETGTRRFDASRVT